MKIYVQTLSFGTVTMDVKSNQTIADVRKMLHRKLDNLYDGYDIEMVLGAERASTWILGEKVLEEDSLLADHNIEKDDTIRATFHLIGEGTSIYFQFWLIDRIQIWLSFDWTQTWLNFG